MSTPTPNLTLPCEALADFCRRWKITHLEIFGSALRDDFRPDSDIDLLATFAPDSNWSLIDIISAQNELAQLLNRPVDLLTRSAVERSPNYIRRQSILSTARTIYAA